MTAFSKICNELITKNIKFGIFRLFLNNTQSHLFCALSGSNIKDLFKKFQNNAKIRSNPLNLL